MYVIQPHYHAIARTAQDYERMAMSGVVAVCEPSFWAGFEREYPETFLDYFKQITEYEPTRAAQYGIRHYSWVAVNPKEAENVALTRAVCERMPEFFDNPHVLGIGEIGLHQMTRNECETFELQIQIAIDHNQLILVHTPHLDDKLKGTQRILEILSNFSALNPDRVWVDHVEEHTVRMVMDHGYWAGMTLYPMTKMTAKRAADVLEVSGWDRMLVNSSADWGPSDPFTLQECIMECSRRGFTRQELLDIFHNNACQFLGQNPKWDIKPVYIREGQVTG
ncbi:MAG: TatD family hydrolase [Verrucomicrobiae bacterium]|nr:TatD family hydrolase [Verrucomicrobiae bacterium]NNJ86716.1 metal-dependent hydrolase [Akkermansiaceae bacterium]